MAFVGFGLVVASSALIVGGEWSPALIVVGLTAALAGLTLGVHDHGWVTALDGPTTSWIDQRLDYHPRLATAAEAVAHIGNPAFIAMAGIVSGVCLSVRDRSPIPALVVIVTTGGVVLAKDIMAAVIERPASDAELAIPGLGGAPHPFPSGHVAGTATLLGIVAVGIAVRGSNALRMVLASAVLAGTAIVAWSRLVLHAHWLSDVVGGTLLAGIAITAGGAVLVATSRSRRRLTT